MVRRRLDERELADLREIMEGLVLDFPSMTEKDKVDLAARLKPIGKACEKIDKDAKEFIKTKLAHREGTVLGNMFKAVLNLVDTKRLNQSLFKEEEPEVHEEYNEDVTDERVTFELR